MSRINLILSAASAGGFSQGIGEGLGKLKWLVAADLWETDTSVFWKRPGVDPKAIQTEVFLLPAASSVEKQGSVSNSGRWAQWRYKAVEPPGEAESDAFIIDQLCRRLKKLYAEGGIFPEPIVNLAWIAELLRHRGDHRFHRPLEAVAHRAEAGRTREGLREISHGHWEGLTRREVEETYPSEYAAWEEDPFTFAPAGGESGVSVLARALPAIREIVTSHVGERVVVVSHKATIRLLLSSLLGFDARGDYDTAQSPHVRHCLQGDLHTLAPGGVGLLNSGSIGNSATHILGQPKFDAVRSFLRDGIQLHMAAGGEEREATADLLLEILPAPAQQRAEASIVSKLLAVMAHKIEHRAQRLVVAAVKHQRRHLNRGQDRADVDLGASDAERAQ